MHLHSGLDIPVVDISVFAIQRFKVTCTNHFPYKNDSMLRCLPKSAHHTAIFARSRPWPHSCYKSNGGTLCRSSTELLPLVSHERDKRASKRTRVSYTAEQKLFVLELGKSEPSLTGAELATRLAEHVSHSRSNELVRLRLRQ